MSTWIKVLMMFIKERGFQKYLVIGFSEMNSRSLTSEKNVCFLGELR